MLPLHRAPHSVVRYKVKSNDVLSHNRVEVEDDHGNTIWYKERDLTENEIVDSVYQNTSPPSLRWSVHTPKRGWYIRLRCPAFPPGAFVTLKPHEPGPEVVTGTLVFGCQTFAFDYAELLVGTPRSSLSTASPSRAHAPSPTITTTAPLPLQAPPNVASTPTITLEEPGPVASSSSAPLSMPSDGAATASSPESKPEGRYSYPPTPETGSTAKLLSTPSPPQPQHRPTPPPMQVSHFVLTPTSRHRVRHHGAGASAITASSSHVPSFLSRILPSSLHEPGANSYTSAFELDVKPPPKPSSQQASDHNTPVPVLPPRPPPLLTFLDETPTFSVRTQGSIELNARMEARFGVDRAFWITISLAFLDFLEQRDAFLASEESA